MEVTTTPASLKRRWKTPAGRELAERVQRALAAGEPIDDLGLGVVDGRADLRGIAFATAHSRITGVRLGGLDLSGAALAALEPTGVTIENCRFDGADCRDWHPRGCTISDTSLARADLRDAVLGEWSAHGGNVYTRVSFAASRWQRATTSAATYVECDFSECQLDRVNFWQSTLVQCTFAGPLRDVVFDGRRLGEGKPDVNHMEGVDLSRAVLDGCEFRGLSLASVRLPTAHPLIRIADGAVLDRAVGKLPDPASDPSAAVVAMAVDHARGLLAMGGEAVLNPRDFGPAGDLLLRVLNP